MSRRHAVPRKLNAHRPYEVDQVARACKVHRNTVRNWIKNGLVVLADERPTLINGACVREFLAERRTKAKRPCPPGHLYCFRCQAPTPPTAGTLQFEPTNPTSGNLRATCSQCGTLMYRCARIADLDRVRGDFAVTLQGGQRHIGKTD